MAQDGTAKGDLMIALNDKLNARIDEEVGEDNSRRDNEAEAMQTKVLTRTGAADMWARPRHAAMTWVISANNGRRRTASTI